MSRASKSLLDDIWYGDSPLAWPLLPLAWLYQAVTGFRRVLFRWKLLRSQQIQIPVIVVGNITVGGTGKTPVVVWLASALQQRGFSPGIVSRGYRGAVGAVPVQVSSASDPAVVGDEAILLAGMSGCPVVVHPDRVAAATSIAAMGVDVIIADDGLQHYRLARDVEIAVFDGERGTGNGLLLPAGPLREPVSRLSRIDLLLVQGELADGAGPVAAGPAPRHFSLQASMLKSLDNADEVPLKHFAGRTIHAVAGIGNPERFFRLLESFGLNVIRHPLPDHAKFSRQTLEFADGHDVVMTEKDAVKCRLLDTGNCWYVPVHVVFEGDDGETLLEVIDKRIVRAKAEHT